MSRSLDGWRPSCAASSLAFFEAQIAPKMHWIGELPFVAAVREALPWSFAGLAAGFIAVFIDRTISGTDAGVSFPLRLTAAFLPAFGVMAATLAVLLALRFAARSGAARAPLVAGSVLSFYLVLPRPFSPDVVAYLRTLGASGLFLAILACGVTGAAVALARRVSGAAAAQWAGAALAAALFGVALLLHVSLAGGIVAAMQPLAHLGDSYAALMIIVIVETLLWTAGVHGPAVLAAVVTPVYLSMQIANTHALGAHEPLPFIVVVSLFLFVFPGGAGATLSLAALLATSRVPHLRKIGRVTLLPALFNVNDPLLFGTPVVFNPFFVIPFVGAPMVLATITYAAVALGFVSRAAFYVPSFVPSVVATYLATGDVRAIVLTAVNIVLALAMYYPFVRAYERHLIGVARAA